MKKEILKNLKTLTIAIILGAGVLSVSAWTAPGSVPPDNNSSSPISISGTSQTKSGSLWASGFFTEGGGYFGGDVGIGTDNPQGPLHVTSGSCYYRFSSDGLHTNCPVSQVINLVISSDTANYNIATALGNPSTAQNVILTINSGVKVYSNSTSQPALDTGTLPSGTTIKIVNNGYIVGKGGDGGRGGGVWSGGCCWNNWADSARVGTAGGNALELRLPVTIDNTNGNIWSGGGGGGGGAGAMMWSMVRTGGGGGGGAGGGLGDTDVNGMTCYGSAEQHSCGSGNYCTSRAGAGANGGIITGPGVGGAGTSGGNQQAQESCDENGNCSCSVGAGGNGASGTGGTGGDYGQSGNTGGSSSVWGWCGCSGDNYSQSGGANGGAAGKAIITNSSSITWLGGNNGSQVKGAVQ